MSVERRCTVVRTGPSAVWLRSTSAACDGCSGCSGRCGLFAVDGDELELPLACIDGRLVPGDSAILSLDPAALRREALLGYGRPLGGLLLGAALGLLLAHVLTLDQDASVAVTAALGTLAGLGGSKRRLAPACRARPASPERD